MATTQQAGRAAEGLEGAPPLLLWWTPGWEPGQGGSNCRTGQWDLKTEHFTDSFTVNLVFCLGLPVNAIRQKIQGEVATLEGDLYIVGCFCLAKGWSSFCSYCCIKHFACWETDWVSICCHSRAVTLSPAKLGESSYHLPSGTEYYTLKPDWLWHRVSTDKH